MEKMIRPLLIIAAVALAWAAWSEHATATAAQQAQFNISHLKQARWDVRHDGRGGDHLWQVNIDMLEISKGVALTADQKDGLRLLGAIDDAWIKSGEAGDRLRALRGK
jgi:hypothetical protein